MKIFDCEQKSETWHLLRAGKLTGTDAHALDTPVKRKGLMLTLISENLSNEPTDDENDMMRGNRLEPEARKAYEVKTGYTVKEIGFAQSDNERVGDSPDGVVEEDEKIVRVIEIKCLSDKNHVAILLEKNIPKEHYKQCIHKFTVYKDAEYIDFVAYNPRISIKPYIQITLNRKEVESEIAEYQEEQTKFINELNQNLIEILI